MKTIEQFFKCFFGYHTYRFWQFRTIRECKHCTKMQELINGHWVTWKEFE